MNFLALCQRIARECGVAGTGPAAVTGQTGEHARIVNWATSAYTQIQNLHEDWDFLWGEDTLNLVEGQDVYTEPFTSNNVRSIDGPIFLYDTDIGVSDKSNVREMDYRGFRMCYLSSARTTDRPSRFTQKPNETAIQFDVLPNKATYRIEYAYWRDSHTLIANTDALLIPTKHEMTVVWRAVMMYAQYEEATNLYQAAQNDYLRSLQDLRQSHLPKRTITMRPLA